MPTTCEQFGKAVVASGVLSADQMQAFWAVLQPANRPADGRAFAAALVKAGKLNAFQASEILAGRGGSLVRGDYVFVDKIGAGGMGEVFKARHRHMDRIVAFKIVSPQAMKDEAAVQRFRREVKAAARLEHPNIVTAHDAGEAKGQHYLVMQYVEGSDLSALVRQQGPLPVDLAVQCILQAARGLAYAHGEGIIHRDIKPANLLLDKKGVIKILDMGLARLEDASTDNLTATEQVMGTVDYMSPEQATSTHTVDGRTDIYSLGCTLWFLLMGRKIFDGDTLMSRMLKHREAPIPSLCHARDDVPYTLEEIYQRMVAKLPEDRYQSMDAVVRELENLQANTSGLSRLAASGDSALKVFDEFAQSTDQRTSTRQATQKHPVASLTAGDAPTVDFREPGVGTSPRSEISVEPLPKRLAAKQKKPPVVLIAAAAAGVLALLLGVIFIIRDQEGNELARVEAPEGATIEVQKKVPSVSVSPRRQPPPAAMAPFDVRQARSHQAAWSKYLGTTVDQTNFIGMTLVLIPPGEFMMGSTPEQSAVAVKMAEDAKLKRATDNVWDRIKEEMPQHRVTLTKPYWLGITEVTIGQFKKFVEATKYVTEAERFGFGNSSATKVDDKITPEQKKMTWHAPGYTVTDDSPVTQITWNDAVQFCNWLSNQEKLPTCYSYDPVNGWLPLPRGVGYRLPTEAEWEYACRAGTTTQFSFGDDPAMLDIYGWFSENAGGSARAVRSKVANSFGLFDMHGNVWEWCQDVHGKNYYSNSPPIDPTGAYSLSTRVTRGGYWAYYPVHCRSAYRNHIVPINRNYNLGFRVVRVNTGSSTAPFSPKQRFTASPN